ncbi:Hemocyte protein-glutamine gamma-glutamyltransferase [Armadillidium nasatum]|uniref:Hemocyte protein-glutamine gamma-glutamyltransferase n=1 Tax=Armadillidium nasatum TaxID=96803 RepID=A0A5N5SS41_9CRUS|nr:Hemocyte protein-glutamine gamma-glutamyltransferase [Armadillidium nasatum]
MSRNRLGLGPTMNKVENIHWYLKENAKRHHTSKFDQIHDPTNPKPVLRRGQTFYMAIRLKDRDFDLEIDRLVLNFKFGSRPSVRRGTMAVIPVPTDSFDAPKDSFDAPKDDWDCKIETATNGKDLVLQMI